MGTSTSEFTCEIDEGIIPRAVREIFTRMTLMQEYMFSVRISFIELYKEQLYDLLSPKGKKKEDCVVDIREDPKVIIFVRIAEILFLKISLSSYQRLESSLPILLRFRWTT